MSIARDHIQRIAGFELNALRAAEVLGEQYEQVRVRSAGTRIHDLNGTPLYHRLPLARGENVGYVDVAVHEASYRCRHRWSRLTKALAGAAGRARCRRGS
jgi:hypothetical protein